MHMTIIPTLQDYIVGYVPQVRQLVTEDNGEHKVPPSLVTYRTPEDTVLFRDKLLHLSPDAQFIVDIVLQTPEESLRIGLKGLQEKLQEMGWKRSRIFRAVEKIKKCLA